MSNPKRKARWRKKRVREMIKIAMLKSLHDYNLLHNYANRIPPLTTTGIGDRTIVLSNFAETKPLSDKDALAIIQKTASGLGWD